MLKRKIVHVDLDGGTLRSPEPDPRYEGLYVVFWSGGVPVAHRDLLARDLPIPYRDLAVLRHAARRRAPSPPLPQARAAPPAAAASVVVCTRDRPEILARCLDSLAALTDPPQEIVVVDNAPATAPAREVVGRLPGVRYVVEPAVGLDRARNTGIRESRGEVVAFVDDDVIVHPGWLGGLLHGFTGPSVMAVTGLVLPAELDTEAQLHFETHWGFNRGYEARTFDAAFFAATRRRTVPIWEIGAGASMAFRREVFTRVGEFDDRLDVGAAGCCGDSELWYRILAEGLTCRYEPSAVAFHRHRRELPALERQIEGYMRGHVASLLVQYEKYGDLGNLLRVFAALPRGYVRMAAKGVAGGFDLRHRLLPAEIRGCVSGLRYYLRHRRPRRTAAPRPPSTTEPRSVEPLASAAAEPAVVEPAGSGAVPTVSVVIPCYNHARFLGEAIESALDQTCREVEIVVVDDGSTDDTASVAARYPGVVYVRQENQGLAAARNTGVRSSRGAFLVFLDADDRLLPNAIDAGLECFARHPDAAFVSGDHRRIALDGTPIATPEVPRVQGDHYLALLRGNYIGMHATVMYRREAVEQAGGFDPTLPACEDYDLYLRIARDLPVHQHEAVVAEYRRYDGNMSRDLGLMLGTVLRVLRAQEPHVRADGRRQEAYRDGLAIWRAYYGDELLRQLKTHLGMPRARRKAAREAVTVLRYAPRHAAVRIARRAARRGLAAAGVALPVSLHGRLDAGTRRVPSPGRVDFGDLRRTTPISRVFGFDRGLPIDRYYIERFLDAHGGDVRGGVLEVGDDTYTRKFGADRVTRSDVLHVAEGNPRATLVGDLATADHIPAGSFDCIILTQTLHLIYDLRAAVATLYRILRPGGVLLATVPGVSQLEHGEWAATWYWSFTTLSARRVLEERFPASYVSVEAYGNVLAATAFLHGLAAEELRPDELDDHDPLYQVTITMRATKPETV